MTLATSHSPATALFSPVSGPRGFTAMVRPHLLYVQDLHQREHLVEACLQAWNIGMLGDDNEREAAIGEAGRRLATNTAPAKRLASSETAVLRALVDQRRQTFPFLRTAIRAARLRAAGTQDELQIDSPTGQQGFLLTWQPTLADLLDIQAALAAASAQSNNLQQALNALTRHGNSQSDVWATRACNQCRLLLLELSTQRAMIAGLDITDADAAQHQAMAGCLQVIEQIQQWAFVFLGALEQPV